MKDVGRLLYVGGERWTHAACALWSSGVVEQPSGVLRRVYSTVSRAKKMVQANVLTFVQNAVFNNTVVATTWLLSKDGCCHNMVVVLGSSS